MRPLRWGRRRFMAGVAGTLLAPWCARGAAEGIAEMIPAIRDMTGGSTARPGKVELAIPRLADNGHLVPCRIRVESPMTETMHVRRIGLFSEKNPRPVIAIFHLGPRAGRAEIHTRIRLAGTQRLVAVAELSDGSFWYGMAQSAVTVSACLDGT